MSKKVLVCGAGGFIGSHLCQRLKSQGHMVVGVDIKEPEFANSKQITDEFIWMDLRDYYSCLDILRREQWDEVYQLAADMGGAGYLFTGKNDTEIVLNSSRINHNIVGAAIEVKLQGKIFFSSSACIYPVRNQQTEETLTLLEGTEYPAEPDSEYGWEKLMSERLYLSAARTDGLKVKIARFHNVFGPKGTWIGGKEKAPAALCRKVSEIQGTEGEVEVWGDGKQTRSFLYIDDCLDAIELLMESEDFDGPVNIGSEETVTISELVDYIGNISGKKVHKKYIPGPEGVRCRTSDNRLIYEKLGWTPKWTLYEALKCTYSWVDSMCKLYLRRPRVAVCISGCLGGLTRPVSKLIGSLYTLFNRFGIDPEFHWFGFLWDFNRLSKNVFSDQGNLRTQLRDRGIDFPVDYIPLSEEIKDTFSKALPWEKIVWGTEEECKKALQEIGEGQKSMMGAYYGMNRVFQIAEDWVRDTKNEPFDLIIRIRPDANIKSFGHIREDCAKWISEGTLTGMVGNYFSGRRNEDVSAMTDVIFLAEPRTYRKVLDIYREAVQGFREIDKYKEYSIEEIFFEKLVSKGICPNSSELFHYSLFRGIELVKFVEMLEKLGYVPEKDPEIECLVKSIIEE